MIWQREFFRLAGVYLACRLRIFGGEIEDPQLPRATGDLAFELLGMYDHQREMELLLTETRKRTPAVSLSPSPLSLPS